MSWRICPTPTGKNPSAAAGSGFYSRSEAKQNRLTRKAKILFTRAAKFVKLIRIDL
jgi:hypothetical protein